MGDTALKINSFSAALQYTCPPDNTSWNMYNFAIQEADSLCSINGDLIISEF